MTQQVIPQGQTQPNTIRLRPENVMQTPNIMYEGARLYNPPTLGTVLSWLAHDYPDRVKPLLRRVTKDSGELALKSWDALLKGMALQKPPPRDRLILYRRKPSELWLEQRAKFPRQFLEDWFDWERLEGHLIEMPPETPVNATSPMLTEAAA